MLGGIRRVQGPGASWWPVRALLTPVTQVAGLGNYGLWGTRHSVGMELLDRLARQLAVAEGWRMDKRCCADVTLATAHGLELVLLKPRRFMNLNGLSVASAGEQPGQPQSLYCHQPPVTALLSPCPPQLTTAPLCRIRAW